MIRGYGSMTFFPMVLVVWFAEVWLGKPPFMAITLFWDRGRAKTATTCNPLGKTPAETAIHGDHAFFNPTRAKNSSDSPPL